MPSDREMVPSPMGKPPAACTPSLTALASRSSDRLHGVISFHDAATPICDLTQSSSPMPTARSIPRAAVCSRPSVTSRLRGLTSGADEPLARRASGADEPLARRASGVDEPLEASEGIGQVCLRAFRRPNHFGYPGGVSRTVDRMKPFMPSVAAVAAAVLLS